MSQQKQAKKTKRKRRIHQIKMQITMILIIIEVRRTKTTPSSAARRRQRNRSVFVPFYVAHVFRRCGHTGPIKVLLKEEKKKKRRVSTKEEDEEEEARRSVSSVSGIYDERIASVYDLLQNLTTQRLQVIDTRSKALFLGKVRRGAKTGPSSKNGGRRQSRSHSKLYKCTSLAIATV